MILIFVCFQIYALMTAKDVDEGLSLLRKVVEIKGGEFFTKIQKSDPHVFWRELKSWGPYLGKVFLTDISDMVALCEKLKSSDPIIFQFWI